MSIRKMEKLARSLGIENLSPSRVSEMTKGLNEQVQDFRSRPLTGRYPVIWTDALYEKVRVDGHAVSMAVLVAAIRESFPGASWQRCKVHFMRNILAHVPQKGKDSFAAQLKKIWLAPSAELARQRAKQISERYEKRFPKAIER
ncbi:putative transposase [Oscillibacter valericigenes Sjm18-20]|nr:putative transposase [Oscillibacter valericigenes Sjm18-20]